MSGTQTKFDWMYDPKYDLFDDLSSVDEITTQEDIYGYLGDIIIIENYKPNFDYLFNRVVAIGELCWGNLDEHGEKLQRTPIKIKHRLEDNDSKIRIIPLNRLMYTLSFIRPLMPYIEYINLDVDWKMLLTDFSHADMQIFTAENLFLDHYRENETIREINNTEYPQDMQTADIVEENKRRYIILEDIMVGRGILDTDDWVASAERLRRYMPFEG